MRLCALAVAVAIGFAAVSATVQAGDSSTVSADQRPFAGELAMSPPIPSAERWAAPPLILRSRAMTDGIAAVSEGAPKGDEQRRSAMIMITGLATALLAVSLLHSLFLVALQSFTPARSLPQLRPAGATQRPATEAEYEAKCRQLFTSVSALWNRAETAVFDLDEGLPLRSLLFKEMKQIQQRLAMDPALQTATPGAVTAHHEKPYWKSLSQRLNQSARDLNRIGAVAEAAGAGFGGQSNEPRIPKTRDEACFILGANREADLETLQRLVKALRQCWHPDLAQSEQDRRHRDARIKQINAAHDLITGKRSEG